MPEDTVVRRVDRLIVVRSRDGDPEGAIRLLDELPGVHSVCLDRITGSFNVLFDPRVVSDDELAAALDQYGYEVTGWQEIRLKEASAQRSWLIAQIGELVTRAGGEHDERSDYAEGLLKGAADAYARTGRAFGLVRDEEIRELIPARFLEHA
jgi:hypothetical protein